MRWGAERARRPAPRLQEAMRVSSLLDLLLSTPSFPSGCDPEMRSSG